MEEGPEAVDFDALHAALGDPLALDELPLAAIEGDDEELLEGVGESSGATNAAYASARPHTIPPSYSPVEDLDAPPVIVASEDTVPSALPNMTVPVARPHALGHTPQSGIPFVAGSLASNPLGVGRAPSGPQRVGYPVSGPHLNALPGHPGVPRTNSRGAAQMTMRMPERPLALNPRRGKTPTLVVRRGGPSAKQKVIAFMAMLLLVTACGIAVIIWRKPRWVGLDAPAPPVPSAAAPARVSTMGPADPGAAITPSSVAPAHPAPSASASAAPPASAPASVAPKPRPRPPAPPASAAPPRL